MLVVEKEIKRAALLEMLRKVVWRAGQMESALVA